MPDTTRTNPFRPTFWRSPLRGPWLTSVLGLVLLVGLTLVFVTGLLSYDAYNPWLGGKFNDPTPGRGILGFYLFEWPTRPVWLYRLTQGVHVLVGLALVPVLLAKLWSVIPKLFAWPPVASPAQAIERLSLLLLVGGGFFEFATGIVNIQYWYVFPTGFYAAHFYGAWVFVAALVVHVAFRTRIVVTALRSRSLRGELRTGLADTHPEPPDSHGLVAQAPAPPTMTRRGLLALVGGGSLLILAMSAGQTIGGPLRRLALLAPRGGVQGTAPGDFPVNKTAAYRGITVAETGPDWRLLLVGRRTVRLSRADLLALPQHTERLPIACVEGWSTVQDWTGVRLRDLVGLAGLKDPGTLAGAHVESLQRGGGFGSANLAANQLLDPRSLLALRVNGADLSLDHGFPARVMVANGPGVHNTKWVSAMTFHGTFEV
ncbi:Oxidoreductase molybdopterin binding domain-containing protein [Actinopolymorpha cephalotaxi]|uniref:DMSO/TMAO reductase YedYZ molybdopterin-dependent catalytic subunit n=1 Tax=Actinopolymorpha cephalotaxi TaxID=504797 RepID=A0A1I3C882_9ACTN|nr:molybdopterin-dependent oxidoreductase [Actinopolymorpha cephalotaxi]NYH86852.1 DMSO/TMAO reductase YedYZ molybdopterin-dependent catalytic subunit [Actinopolymorpha cephalotaxi]SFH70722.1 Oxidoreductase molybdopterin binding domain-containing protein [Actinopolymorpha cephalotaxi]